MEQDEDGAVTAEAAVVLPVLALLALVLAWFVTLGVAQVRATDAAREVARGLARGDAQGSSLALGERVAPQGARFRVSHRSGTVVVEVTVPVRAPLDVLGFLPERQVSTQAVALEEGQ
jgi:hypothetical protein